MGTRDGLAVTAVRTTASALMMALVRQVPFLSTHGAHVGLYRSHHGTGTVLVMAAWVCRVGKSNMPAHRLRELIRRCTETGV